MHTSYGSQPADIYLASLISVPLCSHLASGLICMRILTQNTTITMWTEEQLFHILGKECVSYNAHDGLMYAKKPTGRKKDGELGVQDIKHFEKRRTTDE